MRAVLVFLVIWLFLNLPFASATQVNILWQGQTQDSVQLQLDNLISREVDIVWRGFVNPYLRISIYSASLEKAIEKVLIYNCRDRNPVECVSQVTPETYVEFANIEIPWDDIMYIEKNKQVANLLILVKLKDGRTIWSGSWYRIERRGIRNFNIISPEISRVDVHAKSPDLINAIKFYLQSNQVLPFAWIEKAVFYGASRLYSIGGNEAEWETATGLSAVPVSGDEIKSIAKDFYLIFPNTTSGINNPITLNKNPEFTCGDGICDSDLGESSETCCLDCGCPSVIQDDQLVPQYCDNPDTGQPQCKLPPSQLQITGPTTAVTECLAPTIPLRVTIPNAPLSLQQTATGSLILGGIRRPITCQLSAAGSYLCDAGIEGFPECGTDSYHTGPGEVELTISYKDADNLVTQTLYANFTDIAIPYDCGCQEGLYCDSVEQKCKPKSAIALTASITSYYHYDESGQNFLNISARVLNAPGGMTLESAYCSLGNITWDGFVIQGASQSLNCTDLGGGDFFCQMPFTIPNYNRDKTYVIRNNFLNFTITYPSGATRETLELSTPLADITIPAATCGDHICDTTKESSETCCLDCGCPQPDQYCDPYSAEQCKSLSDINLTVVSVSPSTTLKRCGIDHQLNLTIRIQGPSNFTIDSAVLKLEGQGMPWPVNCFPITSQVQKCQLLIPAGQGCDETIPGIHKFTGSTYYVLTPLTLDLTISFPNGYSLIQQNFQVDLPQLVINATCLDEPCPEGYYCDVDPQNPVGECKPLSGMRLVIDNPKSEVRYDSCEVEHDMNIRMHIDNPPTQFQLNSYTFVINGSTAEFSACELLDPKTGSMNCTVRIPAFSGCKSGRTYLYQPNRVSVYLSYLDGTQTRVSEINASLPAIRIHQQTRTLTEIMEDSSEKLQRELDRAMRLAKKLERDMERCTKFLGIMLFLVSIGMIGSVLAGGFVSLKDPQKGKAIIETVAGAGQMGVNLVQGICSAIAGLYNTQMQITNIYLERQKMEMCIQMQQHMMDTGMCKGAEQQCFDSMMSCLEKGMKGISTATNNVMEAIKKTGESVDKYMDKMADAAAEVADAIEDMRFRRGGLYLVVDGAVVTSPYAICAYSDAYSSGQCKTHDVEIRMLPDTSCRYYRVIVVEKDGKYFVIGKNIYDLLGSSNMGIQTQKKQEIHYRFWLSCTRNPNDPEKAYTDRIGDPIELTVFVPEKGCKCSEEQVKKIAEIRGGEVVQVAREEKPSIEKQKLRENLNKLSTTTKDEKSKCGLEEGKYYIWENSAHLWMLTESYTEDPNKVDVIQCLLPAGSKIRIDKIYANAEDLKKTLVLPLEESQKFEGCGYEAVVKELSVSRSSETLCEGTIFFSSSQLETTLKKKTACTWKESSEKEKIQPVPCDLTKGAVAWVNEDINVWWSAAETVSKCTLQKNAKIKIIEAYSFDIWETAAPEEIEKEIYNDWKGAKYYYEALVLKGRLSNCKDEKGTSTQGIEVTESSYPQTVSFTDKQLLKEDGSCKIGLTLEKPEEKPKKIPEEPPTTLQCPAENPRIKDVYLKEPLLMWKDGSRCWLLKFTHLKIIGYVMENNKFKAYKVSVETNLNGKPTPEWALPNEPVCKQGETGTLSATSVVKQGLFGEEKCLITDESPTFSCKQFCDKKGSYSPVCIKSENFRRASFEGKDRIIKKFFAGGCRKFFGDGYHCYCVPSDMAKKWKENKNNIPSGLGTIYFCDQLGCLMCVEVVAAAVTGWPWGPKCEWEAPQTLQYYYMDIPLCRIREGGAFGRSLATLATACAEEQTPIECKVEDRILVWKCPPQKISDDDNICDIPEQKDAIVYVQNPVKLYKSPGGDSCTDKELAKGTKLRILGPIIVSTENKARYRFPGLPSGPENFYIKSGNMIEEVEGYEFTRYDISDLCESEHGCIAKKTIWWLVRVEDGEYKGMVGWIPQGFDFYEITGDSFIGYFKNTQVWVHPADEYIFCTIGPTASAG